MAVVRTSITSDAKRTVAPDVSRAAERAVDVSGSGEVRPVEVGQRVEAQETPVRERPSRAQDAGQYVENAAARDLANLASRQQEVSRVRQQESMPAQRAESRQDGQMRDRMAAVSGFAPMQGQAAPRPQEAAPVRDGGGGVPVMQVPDSLPTAMSSRAATVSDANKGELAESMQDALPDELSARGLFETARERAASTSQQRLDQRSRESAEASSDAPRVEEGARSTQAAIDSGRPSSAMNRAWGYSPKSREARLKRASTVRPASVIKAVKNRMANAFKRSGVGYRIYQKMLASPILDFREIGVGIQEIVAAVDQNADMVNRLFSVAAGEQVDASVWSSAEIMQFVNSHEVYVGTFKPPNNRGEDVQRRRLRIMGNEQRGIYLHPIMAAMYTADFDGDDMEISLDPQVAELARDPMSYMVGIDGKTSLDVKFLPVAPIVGGYAEGKTERDYVREVILSGLAQVDGRTLSSLVDAILELGESAVLDEDTQAARWASVFYEARRVSDAMNPGNARASDAMMSRICQSVYSNMHAIRVQNALTSIDADIVDMESLPTPRTYSDIAIYKVADGIVRGEVPNNFQELKLMLSGFIGNARGKNAPFRFTADVGKMMKMDSRLQIGDGSYVVNPNDAEQMRMFFESTLKFAESHVMAKEIKKAGRSQYYTQMMRDAVIREVGFPENHGSYAKFLDAFCKSYNRNSAIINEANLVYLSNGEISSDSNRGLVSPLNPDPTGVTLGNLAEPMLSIYGTYSVGRLFSGLTKAGVVMSKSDPRWKGTPGHVTKLTKRGQDASKVYEREYVMDSSEFWVTGKYMSYSLRKFKNENRLLRDQESIYAARSFKLSDIANLDEAHAQMRMLMAIADKRTGAASKYNKSIYGFLGEGRGHSDSSDEKSSVSMLSDLLTELNRLNKDGTVSGRRDQSLWISDVVETIIASGPEMFNHFGMDSAEGFLQSKWAKKLMEHAGDIEALGGVRTAMVFDYRMERVNSLMDSLPDPDAEPDAFVDAYQNLEFAWDELSSSSEVWRGIAREMEAEATSGMESVFQILASGRLPVQTSTTGEEYVWSGDNFYDAWKFWNNPGEHTSLRSVIEDLDMDRETKWSIIADVVRYWEHDPYLKSYEVGYQLEVGNDSAYDINHAESQGALSIYRDFEQSFNRWGKTSEENVRDELRKAVAKHSKFSGRLISTLRRLDSSPWELIAIDESMYADSILSVKDKTYAQTEKASQHPWTNAIYAALSFQRNGGYMNDIQRTDDRMLGLQSVDSVGIQDVIHILSDADAELWVYNEYGEIGQITRDILLQNALGREIGRDVEDDIWKFLQQEPRIAMAIRRHNACVMADSDGTGYVGSSLSFTETINRAISGSANPLDHVKYLMRDHPIYAGIISLASPAAGAVTRNERQRIMAIERYLSYQIYQHATMDMSSAEGAAEILDDLGITLGALRSALRSDYDTFLGNMGLPAWHGTEESDGDATFTYMVVSQNLAKYIDEVRENVPPAPVGEAPDLPERPMGLGVDAVSAASFWDVLQELGGAKTAVSTGIEGSETYQFGEWASHMTANDRYADLEAVFDDVGQGWDGAWTSAGIAVEIGDDGSISNYQEIINAKKSLGLDEVVVLVPDGYQVRDRSTDSHGNPVPSLSAYMVSKRSNGAEAFNLKAKKAGLDGKDSITKMQGKYRMVSDDNCMLTADGGGRRASYFEIQDHLRKTAQQNGDNGLMAAKLELAQMMLDENSELGYDDMTLANYMCLADLMLVQDEAGQLHLRSLEMLFSAIKHRLGASVDEMTDAEITAAADRIVNDVSETGVGIAEMNPLDAFDGIKPKSKSSSFSGIRSNSSVFERNYDLLSAIQADFPSVQPMSPDRAAQLTRRYASKERGVRGIADLVQRLSVTRNYSIVGYAGASDGSEEINWTIGPSNAIVIGGGTVSDSRVSEICETAYQLGMTVVVSEANAGKIPSDMIADAMPCSDDGDVIIPCFDMRLNGSEAKPYNGGRFSIFQAPFSRYVVSVEDSINEYELGDAQYRPTKALVDRIKVVDNGSARINAEGLFPNVFGNPAFRNCVMSTSLASGGEVAKLIANGVRCTIDYGVVEGGRGFDQRKSDVDAAIERYRSRWSETDPDGILRGGMAECHPGDIVAWAECEIRDQLTDQVQYVLAPIIPFPLHGSTRGVPETFAIEQVGTVDGDGTLFAVDWSNTSDITTGFAKYFDSSGGANKGMVNFADPIDAQLTLMDGTSVDAYCARASTDSRKIGTDRRIKTMISLMALSRMHGYNFARSDGAFPSDPAHPENDDIRERLLHRRIPRAEWQAWLSNGDMLFTNDASLNAFINYECRKVLANGGNPADYLANVYEDANGVEHNTHVMWEFEAMFDQGLNYEDGLLRFLHSMDPTLCPNGIDDNGEYLFRLYREGDGLARGYDAGVLQMKVPHRLSDGSMSYLWDNVYIGMSFFGEDYSGFSRPNVDGASNFLDAMNTMSYYGMQLDESSARFRAMWASADIARIPRDGGALGKA